jgi:Uncharacterized protein containing a von Willebrand factor type A (vWA) domain
MKKRVVAIILATVMLTMSACGSKAYETNEMAVAEEAPAAEESAAEYEYDTSSEPVWQDEWTDFQSSESYLEIDENREIDVADEDTITMSLKVDTASYTNVARYIEDGYLPPIDAVRTEEFLNYFSYEETMTDKQGPFYTSVEVGKSPYDSEKQMAFIRVKTDEVDKEELPPSNLTFLIDTSGSMDSDDKLPLLKEAFMLLVETLDEDDRVSIVTYAGSSEVVLKSASGDDEAKIIRAINRLEAGGSTNGSGGIKAAYKLAEKNFIEGGNNRIILATDGDFNVGVGSEKGLEKLITKKRESGIDLSILGFGMGNLQDSKMETLSKHGNGNYSYINTVDDAEKVLVEEMGSTLFTVASDVKAQIEFNDDAVKSYRLVGYENRVMANEDFDDDTKDAGEVGAGTDVVMMFELEMREGIENAQELFELRIRYKEPGESESEEIIKSAYKEDMTKRPSTDFRFACAVAGFASLLRESNAMGDVDVQQVRKIATDNLGKDKGNYRKEFVGLLDDYEECQY